MNNTDIKSDLVQYYDRDAAHRSESGIQDWNLSHRSTFLDRCRERDCETILEVGSGPGRDSLFFEENGLRAFPSDLSGEMARHCGAKGLLSARMDSYHLGYLDETFDAVWSLNVLLHVPKASIGEVWREIRRVMKPGAIFFLGVYGGPDSEGPSDRDANEPKRFLS